MGIQDDIHRELESCLVRKTLLFLQKPCVPVSQGQSIKPASLGQLFPVIPCVLQHLRQGPCLAVHAFASQVVWRSHFSICLLVHPRKPCGREASHMWTLLSGMPSCSAKQNWYTQTLKHALGTSLVAYINVHAIYPGPVLAAGKGHLSHTAVCVRRARRRHNRNGAVWTAVRPA